MPASTGQTLSWTSFEGKIPILLVCMPDGIDTELVAGFDTIHARFGDHRIQLMAVAPATAREVREEADRSSTTFPILADPSRVMLSAVGSNPTAVLYDRSGQEVRVYDLTDPAVTPDSVIQDISSMVAAGSLDTMEKGS
jgi:peroxiredoxin